MTPPSRLRRTFTALAAGIQLILFGKPLAAQGLDPCSGDCSFILGPSAGASGFSRAVGVLEPGKYLVLAEKDLSLVGQGQGEQYTLRLRARDCGACPPTSDLACDPNGRITGKLEAGDCTDGDGYLFDVFRFEAPVFTQYAISSTGELAPDVWIIREGCDPKLIYATDSALGVASALEAGMYTIVVSNVAAGQTGQYSLSFVCNRAAFCEERCVAGALECGKPAQGVLAEDDCQFLGSVVDYWRFDVPDGSQTTIDIRPLRPGVPLSSGVFPEACTAPLELQGLCQFIPGQLPSCALPSGSYRLVVSGPASDVARAGQQPYEVIVSTSDCPPLSGQLPGDCTQDGKVDLADAVCLLGYLFQARPLPLSCGGGPGEVATSTQMVLDWDGDARLNLTDAIGLLLGGFQGGPPHALGEECTRLPGCPDACRGG